MEWKKVRVRENPKGRKDKAESLINILKLNPF